MTDPTDPTDPRAPIDGPETTDGPDPGVSGASSIEEAQDLAEEGGVLGVLLVDPAGGAVPTRPRPSLPAVGAWLVFTGIVVALDGWAGGVAAVLVAAAILAGVPRRALGALGVASLLAVPVAVVVEGVPSKSEVAPSFVSQSLWPHHLTFVGLVLVGAWVVLDVVAHRHAARDLGHDLAAVVPEEEPPLVGWGQLARVVLVAVAALAALVASVAVLVQ